MNSHTFQLAQVNIARMRAPLDDPLMEGFVQQLEFINACAERSPGFVWRLQSEAGDATGITIFDDPGLVINMSVWESIESLHDYVYTSAHLRPLQDRMSWFEPMKRAHLALWWVPENHLPDVAAAEQRLDHLLEHGPTREAFTFKQPFPAPQRNQDEALDSSSHRRQG